MPWTPNTCPNTLALRMPCPSPSSWSLCKTKTTAEHGMSHQNRWSDTHYNVTRAYPGPVQIDATDPGRSDLRRRGEFIERVVGDEADVDAVQRGAEPLGHAGQSGDDLTEHVDPATAFQFLGVVHDRLEPQHVFAFGVRLQRQAPEVDLEVEGVH